MNTLQPNQKIEVIVGKKDFRVSYKTRIEEVSADSMMLAMPMSKGFPIILPAGEQFQGKVIADGNVYQFDCRYLDKRFTPLPVWITSLPFNLVKIQQRNHVRVDVSLKVHLQLQQNDQEDVVEFNTVTKDLSGGGALIVTKIPIPLGKMVSLTLSIPEFDTIVVSGEVIRREQPKPDQQLYWLGVKFTDITEKQRNAIIKYVFKVQLQHRKKGL